MISRVWYHWEKWECVKYGMYNTTPPAGMSADEARHFYAEFLRDLPRFEAAIKRVFAEWPISCEHFLTSNINRIAWVGQSSICIESGIPRKFRGGFMELNDSERKAANTLAGNYVLDWELRYKAKGRRVRQDMGAARLRWRDTGGSAGRINERDAGTIVQGYLYSDFAE